MLLKQIACALAVVSATVPSWAFDRAYLLNCAIEAAMAYARQCDGLNLNMPRIVELVSAPARIPTNQMAALSDAAVSVIGPPATRLPGDTRPEVPLSPAECAVGYGRFGPEGTLMPGLLLRAV